MSPLSAALLQELYLDEDVDVVGDLQRHHFDFVLITNTELGFNDAVYSN